MEKTIWKNYISRGTIIFFLLAFISLSSCNKKSFDNPLVASFLANAGKDTVITLDTIINRLDTTVIDTNFHDLLTFDVGYESKNLPVDTVLSVDNGSHELDFTINSDGEDWQYFKAVDVDWITEVTKTDGELKLSVAENKGAARSAYILFSLNKYPAKYKLITLTQEAVSAPVADLLDVVFNTDGTAKDVSTNGMTVTNVENDNPYTITHNDIYNLNIVTFDPGDANIGKSLPVGSGSYFRIDYDANQDFKDNLADGFSIEALVKIGYDNYANPIAYEVGMFGTIWGGGASLMMRTAGGGNNNLSFEINTGGYYYLQAFTPQADVWYHLVGIWDADAGKASFYVDGVLMYQLDLSGKSFTQVSEPLARWFAIGGTPGKDQLRSAFKGSIGIARIYNDPLTADQVKALWSRVNK